jgi:hypothetical protein
MCTLRQADGWRGRRSEGMADWACEGGESSCRLTLGFVWVVGGIDTYVDRIVKRHG